ncbi:hypothetical protein HELRODRAFT_67445, partial [Helobdella robusta]|uniref:SH3 domain-containing YSC84-like protein 1 n=1 Tax=Helobdella robusta TaxID=6412 RepID=T1FZ10_HELRO
VAMFTYNSKEPGDLSFVQGDVFPAQKTDDDWWTGTINGVTGIFPASYVQEMETMNQTTPPRQSTTGEIDDKVASVIAAYPATGPEQLTLQPGQLIHVRKKSPSGWWEGELQAKGQKRKVGWFPANYVKLLGAGSSQQISPVNASAVSSSSAVGSVVAMYNYQGQADDDLSFEEGNVINLIEKTNSDWWKGELNGAVGIFPANYVAIISNSGKNALN